jgi:hypothetical protein
MPDKSGVFTGLSGREVSEANFFRRPVSWWLLYLQMLCIQLRKIDTLHIEPVNFQLFERFSYWVYSKSCKKYGICPRITQHCDDVKLLTDSSACILRNVAVAFDRFPYFVTAEPSHVEDRNYLFLSGRLPMAGQHNTHRSLSAFIYGGLPTAVIIAPTSFKLFS